MIASGLVLGIDEAGRGPAAGPVTVAAVVLPWQLRLDGLNDSKLLSKKNRVRLAREIRLQASSIGIGWADSAYIDQYGLTAAQCHAANQAIGQINCQFDVIILDGLHNYLMTEVHTELMVKADQQVAEVAAASIVAKVARDSYMDLLDGQYPDYGFAANKGYLTASHLDAIKRHGLSPAHRRSWNINVGI